MVETVRKLATVLVARDEATDGLEDVEDAAEETAESMEEAEQSAEDTEDSFMSLRGAAMALGGSMAAAGTLGQRLLDQTRQQRNELSRTAVTTGVAQDRLEDMAVSMADASLSTSEATLALEELSQVGLESEENLRETTLALDMMADATGASMREVAAFTGPVQALDGDLENLRENTDAFVAAANKTKLEMRDVQSTFARQDFEVLEQMGLQADEAAALIGLFGDETGFSGRILRSRFSQAVDASGGDLQRLLRELDLTNEEFREFQREVASCTE